MVTVSIFYLALAVFLLILLAIARAMVKVCPQSKEAPRFSGLGGRALVFWYMQNRFFAVVMLIFGLKLYWIHHYVANVPFWDQWGAEGWALYRRFLLGELRWEMLLNAHNEHRILWTRIWALGQFLVNGQWDIQWQAVSNAFLHSLFGGVFFEVVSRSVHQRGQLFWAGLIVLLFGGPYGCFNLLFGFQSQFYFLQLFGAGALVCFFGARPYRPVWYLGWLCLLCAFFALAAGVLVAGVVLVGTLIRLVVRDEEPRWTWDIAWVLGAAVAFGLGIWATPEVPHHQAVKATGLAHLVGNFIHLAAWPFSSPRYSLDQALGFAVLLWSPWFLCVLLGFFDAKFRRTLGRGYWLLLTFGGWVLGTALACAYSRGNSRTFGYTDRYADLFGMGALVAFIAIGILFTCRYSGTGKRLLTALGFSSAIAWLVGLYFFNLHAVEVSLPYYGKNGENHIRIVDQYVQSGDPELLVGKNRENLPLDDPLLLEKFLADPVFRSFLPWTIREPIPLVKKERPSTQDFLPGGIPPSVTQRPGETLWGSYPPDSGPSYTANTDFQLSHPSRLPFLVLFLGGYPRADGIEISAQAPGREAQALWRTKPGDQWLERRFATSDGEVRLTASDRSEEDWVAFTEPRELGWFSYASILVAKRYDLVIAFGCILLLLVYATYPACFRSSSLQNWKRYQHALAAFRSAWNEWEKKSKD